MLEIVGMMDVYDDHDFILEVWVDTFSHQILFSSLLGLSVYLCKRIPSYFYS